MSRLLLKLFFLIANTFLLTTTTEAKIVANTTYNGKTYYIDVLNTSNQNSVKAEIWFREKNNATSLGDFKVSELSASKDKLAHYADLVCRAKETFDGNKTIVGCLSTVGSVFCAAATISTEGALAFVCESLWAYTVDKGAADCLEGSVEAVAKYLGKERQWKALSTLLLLDEPKLNEVISKSIDYMCDDVKEKKQ